MELFSREFELIKCTSARYSAKIAFYDKQKNCIHCFILNHLKIH